MPRAAGPNATRFTSVFVFCTCDCRLASALSFAARNFKLLDELEEAEKSTKGGADISLGAYDEAATGAVWLWFERFGAMICAPLSSTACMSSSCSQVRHRRRWRVTLRIDVSHIPRFAGLQRPDDTYMSDWQASIFQSAVRAWFRAVRTCRISKRHVVLRCAATVPVTLTAPSTHAHRRFTTATLQSGGEPRVWFLQLRAGDDYPRVAPTIKFVSRIAIDCIDARGNVSLMNFTFVPSPRELGIPS